MPTSYSEQYANAFTTTTTTPITTTARPATVTALTVHPDLATGNWAAVLESGTPNAEVITITAVTGNTFTFITEAESTPLTHATGVTLLHSLTARSLTQPMNDHLAAADPHTQYTRKSLWQAVGDLVVGLANGSVARLPASANDGYVLTTDSTQTSGLSWKAAAATGLDMLTGLGDMVYAGWQSNVIAPIRLAAGLANQALVMAIGAPTINNPTAAPSSNTNTTATPVPTNHFAGNTTYLFAYSWGNAYGWTQISSGLTWTTPAFPQAQDVTCPVAPTGATRMKVWLATQTGGVTSSFQLAKIVTSPSRTASNVVTVDGSYDASNEIAPASNTTGGLQPTWRTLLSNPGSLLSFQTSSGLAEILSPTASASPGATYVLSTSGTPGLPAWSSAVAFSNAMTAYGDMLYGEFSPTIGSAAALHIGALGNVLTVANGTHGLVPLWKPPSIANPMNQVGALITSADNFGTAVAMNPGPLGTILQSSGPGAALQWATPSLGTFSGITPSNSTSVPIQVVGPIQATQTSVTLNVPQSYRNLRIVITARSAAVSASDPLLARFNSDTATNYSWQNLDGNNATASATASITQTAIQIGSIPGSQALANDGGTIIGEVPNYSGVNFNKTIIAREITRRNATATGTSLDIYAGTWANSAAINSITILPSTGPFAIGSYFAVYGEADQVGLTPTGILFRQVPLRNTGNKTTASPTFVPVDAANLPITVRLNVGDVIRCRFTAQAYSAPTGLSAYDFQVAQPSLGTVRFNNTAGNGATVLAAGSARTQLSYEAIFTVAENGQHTFQPVFLSASGTATIANSSTASADDSEILFTLEKVGPTTSSTTGSGLTTLLLDTTTTTDIASGAAATAATWNDFPGASWTFTPTDPNGLFLIEVGGIALANMSAPGQVGSQLVIDPGGANIVRQIGGSSAVAAGNVNVLAGNQPATVVGLATAPLAVKVQIMPTAAATMYCRSATNPATEFISLRVIQISAPAQVQVGPGTTFQQAKIRGTGDKITTSTTFVPVDATNLAPLPLALNVGDVVQLTLNGAASNSGANISYFDFQVVQPTLGTVRVNNTAANGAGAVAGTTLGPVAVASTFTATESGVHTFQPVWRTTAGSLTLINSSTLVTNDVAILFTASKVLSIPSGSTLSSSSSASTLTPITVVGPLSATQGSVTMSVPQAYRNLRLAWQAASDQTSAVAMSIRFNSDSATNYDIEGAFNAGTTPSAYATTGTNAGRIGMLGGTPVGANQASSGMAWIQNYRTTTFHKNVISECTRADANSVERGGVVWHPVSPVPITTITLFPATGNFLAGSYFCLYGESDTVPSAAAAATAGVALLLDSSETSDFANAQTLVPSSWTAVGTPHTFTVTDPAAVLTVNISANLEASATSTSAASGSVTFASRINIDSGAITRHIGGAQSAQNSTIPLNAAGGSNAITLTGLTAGTHTLRVEVYASAVGLLTCLPATFPDAYFLRYRVMQFSPTFTAAPLPAGGSGAGKTITLPTDVPMALAGQKYDGPSVTVSAGQWLLVGSVDCLNANSGPTDFVAQLWDGTTVFDSAEHRSPAAGVGTSLDVSAVVNPAFTTTYKISATSSAAGSTIKATASTNSNIGSASTISAIPIGGAASASGSVSSTNLIQEVVLAGATPSISLATIPATFRDLRIVIVGRSDQATAQSIGLQFNGDSSADYDIETEAAAAGPNATAARLTGQTSVPVGTLVSTSVSSVAGGVSVIDVPNYAATGFQKALVSTEVDATPGAHSLTRHAAIWRNTAPISSILLTPATGSFDVGTTVRLYGEPVSVQPAGSSNTAVGTSFLIQEVVLSSTQSDVTVSNIPQIYRGLRIEVQGRSNANVLNTLMYVRLNGDTGANYDWLATTAQTGMALSEGSGMADANGMALGYFAGALAAANTSGLSIMQIPSYADATWQKSAEAAVNLRQGNASTDLFSDKRTGWWRSTMPVTSLTVRPASGALLAGTVVRVYGDRLAANMAASATASSALSKDVTLTFANTLYDGPWVNLGPGTWEISGTATFVDPVNPTPIFVARLWDGTGNTAASAPVSQSAANLPVSVHLQGLVTLTQPTTYRLSVASNQPGGALKASSPVNSAGNTATQIVAVPVMPPTGTSMGASMGNLIQEVVLQSAQATIPIANLPQTYKDLRLVFSGRSDMAATSAVVQVQMNGDSGASYDTASWQTSSISSMGDGIGVTSGYVGTINGANSPANLGGIIDMLLPDYSRTTLLYKSWTSRSSFRVSNSAGDFRASLTVGEWRNTNPVTSLLLSLPSGANFVAGTVVRVYGEPAGMLGNSSGVGGGGTGAQLLLDWTYAGADITGQSVSAGAWTNVLSSEPTFAISDPNALVQIEVNGALINTSTNAGYCASRLSIDEGAITRMLGGGQNNTTSGLNWLNGAGPIVLSGLGLGTHTINIQLFGESAMNFNVQPAVAHPQTTGLSIRVLQFTQTGAGAGGTTDLIQETVVPAGSGATTLALNAVPQTYKDLRFSLTGRGSASAASVGVSVQFNGDSGSNYDFNGLYATNVAATDTETYGAQGLRIGYLPAGTAPAGYAGTIVANIPDYARSFFQKNVQAEGTLSINSTAGGEQPRLYAGTWRSTTAVQSITVYPESGAFAEQTVLRVYGTPSRANGSGGSAGVGGNLIAEYVVNNDGTPTINLTNIPANYRNLSLRFVGRSMSSSTPPDYLLAAFNSDLTATNYDSEQIAGAGTTVAALSGTFGSGGAPLSTMPVASTTPGRAAVVEAMFFDYARAVFHKGYVSKGGFESSNASYVGTWHSTSLIQSIRLSTYSGAGFAHGSIVQLYGESVASAAFGGGVATVPPTSALSADVNMSSANQFYDGPSITVGPGTWLLTGAVECTNTTTGATFTAQLWDGTTAYNSTQETTVGANAVASLNVKAVVSPASTTTYKISVASPSTASLIKASATSNAVGNNASSLIAFPQAASPASTGGVMTAFGDLTYGGINGTPTRLPASVDDSYVLYEMSQGALGGNGTFISNPGVDLIANASITGGTIPAGVYFVGYSWFTSSPPSETIIHVSSTQKAVIIGGTTGSIQVTLGAPIPANASGAHLYIFPARTGATYLNHGYYWSGIDIVSGTTATITSVATALMFPSSTAMAPRYVTNNTNGLAPTWAQPPLVNDPASVPGSLFVKNWWGEIDAIPPSGSGAVPQATAAAVNQVPTPTIQPSLSIGASSGGTATAGTYTFAYTWQFQATWPSQLTTKYPGGPQLSPSGAYETAMSPTSAITITTGQIPQIVTPTAPAGCAPVIYMSPVGKTHLASVTDGITTVNATTYQLTSNPSHFIPPNNPQVNWSSGYSMTWRNVFGGVAQQILAFPLSALDSGLLNMWYTHLIVRLFVRSSSAATSDTLLMTINGDTSASYDSWLQVTGATGSTNTESLASNFATIGTIPAANSPANECATIEIRIPFYSLQTGQLTFNRHWDVRGSARYDSTTGNLRFFTGGGSYRNNADFVGRLRFTLSSASNFVAGSSLNVFGEMDALP